MLAWSRTSRIVGGKHLCVAPMPSRLGGCPLRRRETLRGATLSRWKSTPPTSLHHGKLPGPRTTQWARHHSSRPPPADGRPHVYAIPASHAWWTISSGSSQFNHPRNVLLRRNDEHPTLYYTDNALIRSYRKPPGLLDHINQWMTSLVEAMVLFLRASALAIQFSPLAFAYPLTPWSWWRRQWYKYLRYCLITNGPCFVKLGQWMSTRLDLFHDELCTALISLTNQAPTHSFNQTRRQFLRAFGVDVHELFEHFPETPIASGAIAQVYRAKLREPDGRLLDVAVKVRHPGVQRMIERDLKILQSVVGLFQRIFFIQWMNLEKNVENFAFRMKAQCDLELETVNLLQFRNNFKDIKSIRFPTPMIHLCHPLILTESFEEGVPIMNYLETDYTDETRRKLAALGVDAYMKMILLDNFVHSDLHPGNLLVDDGYRDGREVRDWRGNLIASPEPAIVVLDVGLITELSPRDQANFRALFKACAQGNGEEAARLMTVGQDHLTPEVVEGFCKEMGELIAQVHSSSIKDVQVGKVFTTILRIGRKYRVIIESNFTSLVIGTVVIEGIGRQLDPDVNLIQHGAPFLLRDMDAVKEFVKARFSKTMAGILGRKSSQHG